jgi:catalase
MPNRKIGGKSLKRAPSKAKGPAGSDAAVGTTVSGPSHTTASLTELADHAAEQQALVEAVPFNAAKPSEYGQPSTAALLEGPHGEMPSSTTGAGTLSEKNESLKTGAAALEPQSLDGSLESKRVNSEGQVLTTNQGVPVANNQDSLKAGLRGPTLLEDFILREKITHFDHERIPERIVHARGSAAHGYFEAYEPLTDLTRAAPFMESGKRTPVFVRFSTVAGERGSADTARDVRGFAVKFYTDEGNWDLVGNNIPVFFIQDAMKFPDLIHAAKPEPHNQMPQAATAHDTFWDFVSLMPESTHMLMWIMSDRAIPRSYRMMRDSACTPSDSSTNRVSPSSVSSTGNRCWERILWCGTRRSKSLVRTLIFIGAICGRRSSQATIQSGNWVCKSSQRLLLRNLASTFWIPPN